MPSARVGQSPAPNALLAAWPVMRPATARTARMIVTSMAVEGAPSVVTLVLVVMHQLTACRVIYLTTTMEQGGALNAVVAASRVTHPLCAYRVLLLTTWIFPPAPANNASCWSATAWSVPIPAAWNAKSEPTCSTPPPATTASPPCSPASRAPQPPPASSVRPATTKLPAPATHPARSAHSAVLLAYRLLIALPVMSAITWPQQLPLVVRVLIIVLLVLLPLHACNARLGIDWVAVVPVWRVLLILLAASPACTITQPLPFGAWAASWADTWIPPRVPARPVPKTVQPALTRPTVWHAR